MTTPLPPVAILAGGLATRLRPVSEKIPKALVEVASKPFILHQLDLLKQNGITHVVLCVGYLGEMVQQFLGDGQTLGLSITYSFDGPTLLGTAGALKRALPLLGNEFFVLYGDSYLECDYQAIYAAFSKQQRPALMTVFRNKDQWDRSNVRFADNRIVQYDKRNPTPEMDYIDYGLGLMRRKVLDSVPNNEIVDLGDVYHTLAAQDQLAGYETDQRFYEVGSFKGLVEFQQYLAEKSPTNAIPIWRCPLCGHAEHSYLAQIHNMRIERCTNCGLVYQQTPPATIDYVPSVLADPLDSTGSLTEQEAALTYFQRVQQRGIVGKNILVLASSHHPIVAMLQAAGYHVETDLNQQELERAAIPDSHFDTVIIIYQLERFTNPFETLRRLHRALEPGGILLMVIPSLDSFSARLLRAQWPEWRPHNKYYFGWYTVQAALRASGFEQVYIQPDRRRYSFQHIYERAKVLPKTFLLRSIQFIYQLTPKFISRNRVKLPTSGMVIVARRTEVRNRPLLSVIMPAYNERATFASTLSAVLNKTIPDVDKEIVIVESNSKDGTRELAEQYQNIRGVKLILEDRPRGKGHAVRTGFKAATGDFILIQDADAEYDVNDYDVLVNTLKSYRAAFVLGSRHSGDWKMRQFADQPTAAAYFNVGHTFFTRLVNTIYRQHLKDPFTMYKVFWRECLYGLEFESNRFDFDFELVIKLVRKGYIPIEIPVNYHSRSLKEGKKVSLLKDPLSWIYASFKFRFSSLFPHPNKPE